MAVDTLKDLYLHGIRDLYSACKQSIPVTEEMAKAATDPELKDALEAGIKGTRDGMKAMEKIAEAHGEKASGEHCKGMEGLVKEARAHALEEEFGSEDVQDAAIIAQYQRLAHYAITGYGTLKAFALRLDLEDDADILDECTAACYEGDEEMTRLAEGGINEAAAD